MRYLGNLLFIILFSVPVGAQVNLVPNPGFDSLLSCPTNAAQVYNAPPWIDPTMGSSDLLNSCSSNSLSSVPVNSMGYQLPYNGSGYAGVVTYVDNSCCVNHREYIQTSLTSSLQVGKTYCVSFRASWADSVKGVTDGLGAFFSSTPVSCAGCFLPYTAQINNPQGHLLNDGNQWEIISGTFVAQGGERYITIGNFSPDSQTTFQTVNVNAFYIIAYYYIDDVSVIEISSCQAGSDIAICPGDSAFLGIAPVPGVVYSWSPSVGLTDTTISNPVAKPAVTTTYTLTQTQCDVVSTSTVTVTVKSDCDVLPPLIIPSILYGNEMLKITGLETGTSLSVFDMLGRKVFNSPEYEGDFGGPGIAAGNYIIWLTIPDGTQYRQKVCIVK